MKVLILAWCTEKPPQYFVRMFFINQMKEIVWTKRKTERCNLGVTSCFWITRFCKGFRLPKMLVVFLHNWNTCFCGNIILGHFQKFHWHLRCATGTIESRRSSKGKNNFLYWYHFKEFCRSQQTYLVCTELLYLSQL